MGYYVEMALYDMVIPAACVPAALEAAQRLMEAVQERGGGGSYKPDGTAIRHYSWVNTETCLAAIERHDLATFLNEWRYDTNLGDGLTPMEQLAAEGNYQDIYVTCFTGEKWGDDEHLWQALAPYLNADAVAEFRGEDGHLWRYVFDGTGFVEETGKIVWG